MYEKAMHCQQHGSLQGIEDLSPAKEPVPAEKHCSG